MRIPSPSEYGSDAGGDGRLGLEQHLLLSNDATSDLRAVDNKRSFGVWLQVEDVDRTLEDVLVADGGGMVLVVDILVADVMGC